VENKTIKVLLVDDDQGDFEMIRAMLSRAEHQEFKLDWVSNYEEAMDAFDNAQHDVYFLDYFLEDRTGLDLLKEARERGITAPIIILTGRGSREVDMEAMKLGASDYLVKGLIDPDALERAIRHAMERAEGARALEENVELRQEAAAAAHAGQPARPPMASDLHGDAARFRAVFESSRSAIAVVDLQGNVLDVNPPFAGFFSPTPRWTEGLSYLELLEESDQEAVRLELEALASGDREKFESARRFLTREGHVAWAHTTMALIRNADGAPDHLVVLLEEAGEGG
jgi:PAS domain S-box-containing protein